MTSPNTLPASRGRCRPRSSAFEPRFARPYRERRRRSLRHSRVPLPGPRRHLFRRLETALLDLSRQRPPRRRVQEELEPHEVNNKGTIRFPLTEPVPAKLIEAIARFRAKEAAQTGRAKTSAAKKRQGCPEVAANQEIALRGVAAGLDGRVYAVAASSLRPSRRSRSARIA